MESEATLMNLPADVLENIVSYLPVNFISCNVLLVCKKLHQIAQNNNVSAKVHNTIIKNNDLSMLPYSIYKSFKTVTTPELKFILSYYMCDCCHKHYYDTNHIYYCKSCKGQTCDQCQSKITSYQSKCFNCVKDIVERCGDCTDIVSGYSYPTDCCRVKICELCVRMKPMKFKVKHTPELCFVGNDSNNKTLNKIKDNITLLCRQHNNVCYVCGHWCKEKIITVCCQQPVCQLCAVKCYGCQQIHCVEHCQNNQCIVSGCCNGNVSHECLLTGYLCSDCKRPIRHDIMCHPILRFQKKYCRPCFEANLIICGKCQNTIPLSHYKPCAICSQQMCDKHMYKISFNGQYVCEHCYVKTTTTCDKCQEIYNLSNIKIVSGTRYCPKCLVNLHLTFN